MTRKKITIVSGCYNEAPIIEEFYHAVIRSTSKIKNIDVDILIIDNSSTDDTQKILEKLAVKDKNLKLIFNKRNFGHIRSPYSAIIEPTSDAVLYLASDMQDPPELIPELVKEWLEGNEIVLGVKTTSKTNFIIHKIRGLYYSFLKKITDHDIIIHSTGFGIYSKNFIDIVRKIKDPYPYLRGMITELGFKPKLIEFTQNKREKGITKNNFYTLYDIGMLGIISNSIMPLRIISFFGFIISFISIIIGIYYFFKKLIFWSEFTAGIAPLIILTSFLFGALFLVIGFIGEYLAHILRYVNNRPIIVEEKRINFEDD